MRRRSGEAWSRVAEALRARQPSLPLLLSAFALGAVTWVVHHQDIPWSLYSGDAYEYAEMARRLATGEGFTTGVVYPAELWLGAERDHPAVKFPPLWPAALAVPFALFGAGDAVVHGVMGLLFATLVTLCAALANQLAGRGAGLCAALAVATTPLLLGLSVDGLSEIPFAVAVTGVFLLCASGPRPAAIGLACGLAYLTRYNGAVLLPMALVLLAARRAPLRSHVVCVACFALVALPWWIRNALVAGSPFYSLLNLNLYIAPVLTRVGGSLFFQLEPDLESGVATDPLEKALLQLPLLLRQLPFASVNLVALLGVLLAGWRRDALSLAFLGCAAATLLVVAFALALGRYFAPFFPVMLALGVAGWLRYGGRLRVPALALLLLAPLLPSLPAPLPDVRLIGSFLAQVRSRPAAPAVDPREASCLAERPRVIAEQAARIAWQHDLVAIYAPVQPEALRRIVAEHPVALVQLRDERRKPPPAFEPRADCGEGWYAPGR